MYTQELVQAIVEDRRREAAQIERQAQAEKALRRSASPRGVPSPQRHRRLSFVARALRTASAS